MNENLHDEQLNKILLKPRFKIEIKEDRDSIIEKFIQSFSEEKQKFSGKIVDHHVVIDVPNEEAHFWSPQLHIELEEKEESTTVVKALFGPKPTVWSLFMFIHFAVALAFLVFLVLFYTRWSLQQNYKFSMIMCIAMPLLWFTLYFLGRLGKRKGQFQMDELRRYFFEILEG